MPEEGQFWSKADATLRVYRDGEWVLVPNEPAGTEPNEPAGTEPTEPAGTEPTEVDLAKYKQAKGDGGDDEAEKKRRAYKQAKVYWDYLLRAGIITHAQRTTDGLSFGASDYGKYLQGVLTKLQDEFEGMLAEELGPGDAILGSAVAEQWSDFMFLRHPPVPRAPLPGEFIGAHAPGVEGWEFDFRVEGIHTPAEFQEWATRKERHFAAARRAAVLTPGDMASLELRFSAIKAFGMAEEAAGRTPDYDALIVEDIQRWLAPEVEAAEAAQRWEQFRDKAQSSGVPLPEQSDELRRVFDEVERWGQAEEAAGRKPDWDSEWNKAIRQFTTEQPVSPPTAAEVEAQRWEQFVQSARATGFLTGDATTKEIATLDGMFDKWLTDVQAKEAIGEPVDLVATAREMFEGSMPLSALAAIEKGEVPPLMPEAGPFPGGREQASREAAIEAAGGLTPEDRAREEARRQAEQQRTKVAQEAGGFPFFPTERVQVDVERRRAAEEAAKRGIASQTSAEQFTFLESEFAQSQRAAEAQRAETMKFQQELAAGKGGFFSPAQSVAQAARVAGTQIDPATGGFIMRGAGPGGGSRLMTQEDAVFGTPQTFEGFFEANKERLDTKFQAQRVAKEKKRRREQAEFERATSPETPRTPFFGSRPVTRFVK